MKIRLALLFSLLCLGFSKVKSSEGIRGYSYHKEIEFTTTKVSEFSFWIQMDILDHKTHPDLINVFPGIKVYWNGELQEIDWLSAWSGCTVKSPKPLTGNTRVVIEIPIYHPLLSFKCNDNEVTTITTPFGSLYGGKYLRTLECRGNKLQKLDKFELLNKLDKLSTLDCSDNQIRELDVSYNKELKELKCNNNQLVNLFVDNYSGRGAGTKKLKTLDCSNNQLTKLTLGRLDALEVLDCSENQLSQLLQAHPMMDEGKALSQLHCQSNQFKMLDLSKSEKLVSLNCSKNSLTVLKLATKSKLIDIDCSKNQLKMINTSSLGELVSLYIPENELTSLNVRDNTKLKYLEVHQNELTSLNVSSNINLERLSCSFNQLTSLNISNNTNLSYLNCSTNQLTSLDVSKAAKMKYLYGGYNQISALDITNNPKLILLYFRVSKLSSLDLRKNLELEILELWDNQLETLDVSNNLALTSLGCSSNRLTSLDVSNNSQLESLTCGGNSLNSIDVSNSPKLKKLWAEYSQLESLDLSNNLAIEELYCYTNQLSFANIYTLAQKNISKVNIGNQYLPMSEVAINIAIAVDTIFYGMNTTFDVAYAMENEDYSVNGGNVTFLKPGIHTLTISNPAIEGAKVQQTFNVLKQSKIDWKQDLLATYGDKAIELNAVSTTGFEIEYISEDKTIAAVSDGMLAIKGAGSTIITAKEVGNDSTSVSVSKIIQVQKAELTIAVNNSERAYGEENSKFTLSFDGLVNNELENVLDTLPTISCSAMRDSPAGIYDIILSDGMDKNYIYRLVNGKLEVFVEPIMLFSFTINDDEHIAVLPIVYLTYTFEGGKPTHYMASDKNNFTGAQWLEYNHDHMTFTFDTKMEGNKSIYTKLKNSAGETEVMGRSIYYKPYYPVTLSSFAINNGTYKTKDRTIALNHTIEAGTPTLYSVGESLHEVGKEWLPYKETPIYTLSKGNTTKEIFFAVSDGKKESEILSCEILLEELQFELYPNPVRDFLNIRFITLDGKTKTIEVYSLNGLVVSSKTFDDATSTLDLSSLTVGIYIVKVVCENKVETRRIIKQ